MARRDSLSAPDPRHETTRRPKTTRWNRHRNCERRLERPRLPRQSIDRTASARRTTNLDRVRLLLLGALPLEVPVHFDGGAPAGGYGMVVMEPRGLDRPALGSGLEGAKLHELFQPLEVALDTPLDEPEHVTQLLRIALAAFHARRRGPIGVLL